MKFLFSSIHLYVEVKSHPVKIFVHPGSCLIDFVAISGKVPRQSIGKFGIKKNFRSISKNFQQHPAPWHW